MTGAPPLLAETPDGDLLSQLLSSVRLTGSVFLDGQFSAPFGVISPARWEETPGFSRLRHASVFHLVTEGGCTMRSKGSGDFALGEGDLVLMPFTAEHAFWNGEHDGFAVGPQIAREGAVPGVSVIDYGGGGPRTRLVCGFIESAELTNRAFATLAILGRALADERLGNQVFLIAGHTDASGPPDYNLALSERRAQTVRDFLIKNFGIAENRLLARGFGPTRLKVPQHPGSRLNRRVQVVNWTSEADPSASAEPPPGEPPQAAPQQAEPPPQQQPPRRRR